MESLFRTTDAEQIRDHLEKHLAHNNRWDQKKLKSRLAILYSVNNWASSNQLYFEHSTEKEANVRKQT